MIEEKDINYELLKNPDDRFFKIFKYENSPDFWYKFNKLCNMMMERYLYISDEYRHMDVIKQIISGYCGGRSLNMFYELGEFQGLVGFTSLIPEYRCNLTFKIWDKSFYSKEMVRAVRKLTDFIMDTFRLVRMRTESPDPRMVKGAELLGFKYEGTEKKGFKWRGKYYDLVSLGKVREF